MSNESTIHIKNIKVLMTEIHKFLTELLPPTMSDIFQKQGNYYCLDETLVSKWKFIAIYGIDTISFKEPQIWQDLLQNIIKILIN